MPAAVSVELIETVASWRATLDARRSEGASIGLVPTMGSLHAGHASLIERAARECDVVGVTVFVNPLQFGAGEDLDSYPRDLEADMALAARHGATYVFAPTVTGMYPDFPSPPLTRVSVAGLTDRFEGACRPGHFDGVATVVTKLFAQAGRSRAYFGEKDFQQLAVVCRLVADLDLPIEVIGCPTVREPDGLALSSRNVYLTPAERSAAPTLYRALVAGAAAARRPGATAEDVVAVMVSTVEGTPLLSLEYAAIVNSATLECPAGALGSGRDYRLLIAARLGRARLIDNLGVLT